MGRPHTWSHCGGYNNFTQPMAQACQQQTRRAEGQIWILAGCCQAWACCMHGHRWQPAVGAPAAATPYAETRPAPRLLRASQRWQSPHDRRQSQAAPHQQPPILTQWKHRLGVRSQQPRHRPCALSSVAFVSRFWGTVEFEAGVAVRIWQLHGVLSSSPSWTPGKHWPAG